MRYRVKKPFHSATRRFRVGDIVTTNDLYGVSDHIVAGYCEPIEQSAAPPPSGDPVFVGVDYGGHDCNYGGAGSDGGGCGE